MAQCSGYGVYDKIVKQRRAWLLLGRVTAERSCPCKQPACPAIGGGSEVTFKPLVPRWYRMTGRSAMTLARQKDLVGSTGRGRYSAGITGLCWYNDSAAHLVLTTTAVLRPHVWENCAIRCRVSTHNDDEQEGLNDTNPAIRIRLHDCGPETARVGELLYPLPESGYMTAVLRPHVWENCSIRCRVSTHNDDEQEGLNDTNPGIRIRLDDCGPETARVGELLYPLPESGYMTAVLRPHVWENCSIRCRVSTHNDDEQEGLNDTNPAIRIRLDDCGPETARVAGLRYPLPGLNSPRPASHGPTFTRPPAPAATPDLVWRPAAANN
ncbi:hypothetical protein J6590_003826 [Homalodisca vitripennis]|nr:hypothetical protein J6590_003826 [Homalodisca vitripennis]